MEIERAAWHPGAALLFSASGPSGGGGGVSANTAPAAAAAAARRNLQLDRLGITCGVLSQAATILSQGGRAQAGSSWERLQPTLVLAVWLVELLLVTCWGRLHARHRTLWIAAFRIAIFSVPSYRHPGVGTALIMLGAAREGVRGAVIDAARILIGTRALTLVLQSSFLLIKPLEPAAILGMQVVLLALTWNPRGYCSLPLLQHPLTQQRIARAAAALEVAALPVVALMPTAGHINPSAALLAGGPKFDPWEPGKAPPEAVCHATLAYSQILVSLVPFFFSMHWWHRAAAQPLPSEPAQPAPLPHAVPSLAHRCAWRAVRAAAACAAAVRCMLLVDSVYPARRVMVYSLLLLHVWVACKLTAGLV